MTKKRAERVSLDVSLVLLERAQAKSGMSWLDFAETELVREESTVHRWRRGEVEIPEIVLRKLRTIVREAGR